jgi:hypothetical protein
MKEADFEDSERGLRVDLVILEPQTNSSKYLARVAGVLWEMHSL